MIIAKIIEIFISFYKSKSKTYFKRRKLRKYHIRFMEYNDKSETLWVLHKSIKLRLQIILIWKKE